MGRERRPQDLDAPSAQGREVARRPPVHRRRRDVEPEAGARPQDRLLGARPLQGLHPRGVRHGREGRQGQSEEIDAPVGRQRAREARRFHRAAQRQDGAARHPREPLPLSPLHDGPGERRRAQGGRQRHRPLHHGRGPGRPPPGLQAEALLGHRALRRRVAVHRPRRRVRRQHSARSPPSRSTGSISARSRSSTP